MTKPTPHNPPAFPTQESEMLHTAGMVAMMKLPVGSSTDERDKAYLVAKADAARGMTLRDYLAAEAMNADISRVGYCQRGEHMERAAANAYAMANAMLEARQS